jgi:heat shock protein HslJ
MLPPRGPTRCGLKRVALALVSAVSFVVPVACESSDDQAEEASADLSGRYFTSTAVTEDGEPRPLAAGTRIEVSFGQGEDWPIGWMAGCNSLFATDAEITADMLVVREIGGTLIGCRHDLAEQEEWLHAFFESDPEWRLSGDHLTLTSGETVIELEAGPA